MSQLTSASPEVLAFNNDSISSNPQHVLRTARPSVDHNQQPRDQPDDNVSEEASHDSAPLPRPLLAIFGTANDSHSPSSGSSAVTPLWSGTDLKSAFPPAATTTTRTNVPPLMQSAPLPLPLEPSALSREASTPVGSPLLSGERASQPSTRAPGTTSSSATATSITSSSHTAAASDGSQASTVPPPSAARDFLIGITRLSADCELPTPHRARGHTRNSIVTQVYDTSIARVETPKAREKAPNVYKTFATPPRPSLLVATDGRSRRSSWFCEDISSGAPSPRGQASPASTITTSSASRRSRRIVHIAVPSDGDHDDDEDDDGDAGDSRETISRSSDTTSSSAFYATAPVSVQQMPTSSLSSTRPSFTSIQVKTGRAFPASATSSASTPPRERLAPNATTARSYTVLTPRQRHRESLRRGVQLQRQWLTSHLNTSGEQDGGPLQLALRPESIAASASGPTSPHCDPMRAHFGNDDDDDDNSQDRNSEERDDCSRSGATISASSRTWLLTTFTGSELDLASSGLISFVAPRDRMSAARAQTALAQRKMKARRGSRDETASIPSPSAHDRSGRRTRTAMVPLSASNRASMPASWSRRSVDRNNVSVLSGLDLDATCHMVEFSARDSLARTGSVGTDMSMATSSQSAAAAAAFANHYLAQLAGHALGASLERTRSQDDSSVPHTTGAAGTVAAAASAADAVRPHFAGLACFGAVDAAETDPTGSPQLPPQHHNGSRHSHSTMTTTPSFPSSLSAVAVTPHFASASISQSEDIPFGPLHHHHPPLLPPSALRTTVLSALPQFPDSHAHSPPDMPTFSFHTGPARRHGGGSMDGGESVLPTASSKANTTSSSETGNASFADSHSTTTDADGKGQSETSEQRTMAPDARSPQSPTSARQRDECGSPLHVPSSLTCKQHGFAPHVNSDGGDVSACSDDNPLMEAAVVLEKVALNGGHGDNVLACVSPESNKTANNSKNSDSALNGHRMLAGFGAADPHSPDVTMTSLSPHTASLTPLSTAAAGFRFPNSQSGGSIEKPDAAGESFPDGLLSCYQIGSLSESAAAQRPSDSHWQSHGFPAPLQARDSHDRSGLSSGGGDAVDARLRNYAECSTFTLGPLDGHEESGSAWD